MDQVHSIPWQQMAPRHSCEQIMNIQTFLEQAKADLHGVEFCPYCIEPRNDKRSCCGENHFINFEDFDDDTQREIIQGEYDTSFKG